MQFRPKCLFAKSTLLLIFRMEFTFYFFVSAQVPFRLDHPTTGEALYLEPFHRRFYPSNNSYHLRRCLIADLATADQFYRDTFKANTIHFRTPVRDGRKTPILLIQCFSWLELLSSFSYIQEHNKNYRQLMTIIWHSFLPRCSLDPSNLSKKTTRDMLCCTDLRYSIAWALFWIIWTNCFYI